MKTICFCNSTLAWGGGENWHLNAALSFARRGWRVFLLCRPDGALFRRAAEFPDIAVVPMPIGRLSFFNPFLRRRLVRFFRNERVHALIMNLPADLKAAGPAARAAGVRHVIFRRGSALPVSNSWLNRRLYGSVITRLVVNSRATRAQALVNNPGLIPEDRITILPNGVDVAAFDATLDAARAADARAVCRALRGGGGQPSDCEGAPFVIGTAGRLNRQKGQHLLLHLGRRLVDAGLDARIVIVGTGERECELKALAASLGLAERVFFPGFMENMAPFWLSIDLFVLTSLWEGFGNVVIEAGLAEKPVFAFAVSNLPELIQEGKNGRLFPLPEEERANCPDCFVRGAADVPGDAPTATPYAALGIMAEAVLALAADDRMRFHMGQAGRVAAERYSQERCMDVLEDLLEKKKLC